MNWGAFAGGLADGIETSQKLKDQQERSDREKEQFDHQKKDWKRQDDMHAMLAAAGNTVDPNTDPSKIMSAEDYAAKYQTPAPSDGGGISGWIKRNFGGSDPAPVAPLPKPDFTSKYNTPVPAESANDYAAWKSGLPQGMDQTGKDYDLGGAFMAGAVPEANGHLPDPYKKPNHPTFSNESVHSGKDDGVGGAWSQDANGKWTFAASADQLKYNSPDDLKNYFSTTEKDSNLVLPEAPKKTGGAFAAADAATKPKTGSGDDYVPVVQPDGKLVYAPRDTVKQIDGPAKWDSVGKAIMQFDPVQGMAMLKGSQELQSGAYKLKAEAIERGALDAGRMWATNPQGALDAIQNLHTLVPDGQQVKMTYDPKTNKVETQFFTETPKGLMPQGPSRKLDFQDVMNQTLSYASPEGYWKNLTLSYQHTHDMATEMNQKATLENEAARLEIARNADKRLADHQAAQDEYLGARTKALEGKVGDGWKPVVRNNPSDENAAPLTGRTNGKTGETQWNDNEWGKFVKPKFMGTYKQINTFAQSKGLIAKAGADGNVYYINPKTNVASTDYNAALKGAAPASK